VKTRVLDSWAVLEWIGGRQPATDTVAKLFAESEAGATRLFMSAINVGEVYYFLRKHHSEGLAESWRELSRTLPATIEVPTADDIWDAALLKGRYPIAYADGFAAALARKHRCPLVTGDAELRSVAGLELAWIGRDRTWGVLAEAAGIDGFMRDRTHARLFLWLHSWVFPIPFVFAKRRSAFLRFSAAWAASS
jgi:ribonuclease VapC